MPTETELRSMIDRYRICYEVWPDWAIVDDKKVQVGFELDLCAGCGKAPPPSSPDESPELETFEQLQDFVSAVLPSATTGTDFEILPWDSSVHQSPRRGFRPEVVLGVQIVHKHGAEGPVDDCEQRCLHDVEQRLKQLGIRRSN